MFLKIYEKALLKKWNLVLCTKYNDYWIFYCCQHGLLFYAHSKR